MKIRKCLTIIAFVSCILHVINLLLFMFFPDKFSTSHLFSIVYWVSDFALLLSALFIVLIDLKEIDNAHHRRTRN